MVRDGCNLNSYAPPLSDLALDRLRLADPGSCSLRRRPDRLSEPAGHGPSQSVAITNVTVIDVVTGRLQNGVTVLTQGERIAGIGPRVTIPRGATRVNGKGRFLIPGLWDMHSHHQGTGAGCLDLFIAKGVVGTRDMGGDIDFILPLRERVKSGAVLGPEIVSAGPILDDAPPAYPYRRRVTNAQQAREAVADLKRAGRRLHQGSRPHAARSVFRHCRGGP